MHPTCSNCSLSWRRQLSKIIKTYSHQTISQILCFPKHFRLFPLSLQMALMNNTGYGIVLEWKIYHGNEFLLHVYEETVNIHLPNNKKKYRLVNHPIWYWLYNVVKSGVCSTNFNTFLCLIFDGTSFLGPISVVLGIITWMCHRPTGKACSSGEWTPKNNFHVVQTTTI